MSGAQRAVHLVVRAWVGVTGAVALGAAGKAYHDQLYPVRLMYAGRAASGMSAAAAAMFGRMYAAWLLVSGVVRVLSAACYASSAAMRLTLCWTYAVALAHYALEVAVYDGVPLQPGGQMPLAVASCSLALMLVEQVVCGEARRVERRQRVAAAAARSGRKLS